MSKKNLKSNQQGDKLEAIRKILSGNFKPAVKKNEMNDTTKIDILSLDQEKTEEIYLYLKKTGWIKKQQIALLKKGRQFKDSNVETVRELNSQESVAGLIDESFMKTVDTLKRTLSKSLSTKSSNRTSEDVKRIESSHSFNVKDFKNYMAVSIHTNYKKMLKDKVTTIKSGQFSTATSLELLDKNISGEEGNTRDALLMMKNTETYESNDEGLHANILAKTALEIAKSIFLPDLVRVRKIADACGYIDQRIILYTDLKRTDGTMIISGVKVSSRLLWDLVAERIEYRFMKSIEEKDCLNKVRSLFFTEETNIKVIKNFIEQIDTRVVVAFMKFCAVTLGYAKVHKTPSGRNVENNDGLIRSVSEEGIKIAKLSDYKLIPTELGITAKQELDHSVRVSPYIYIDVDVKPLGKENKTKSETQEAA